jgi:predicted ATPase
VLSSLHLSSFKCFEALDLQLRPLTLLSGMNGGGKSSVIQALALLAQTLAEREWGRTLLLDGPDLALGSAADVLNQRSARRRLALGAATTSERVVWTFKADDRRALSVELEGVMVNDLPLELSEPVRWLLPASHAESSTVVTALRRLSWITAERTGPRELLPLRDAYGHAQVGARGELAAGLLYWRESQEQDDVSPELCVPDVPRTLFHQVRARMQEFFPGCDLRVSPVEGASAVTLRLRSDSRADFQRPQNVGFGLTQLFPILVAVLAAQKGDVLLIENPEVHLHPQAQQRIGSLLANVARSGVQVIVETHSDHVLNGMRLAVKSKAITPGDVAVHFFSPALTAGQFVPQSPKLDSDGKLDFWPEGFFDQFDLALSQLL